MVPERRMHRADFHHAAVLGNSVFPFSISYSFVPFVLFLCCQRQSFSQSSLFWPPLVLKLIDVLLIARREQLYLRTPRCAVVVTAGTVFFFYYCLAYIADKCLIYSIMLPSIRNSRHWLDGWTAWPTSGLAVGFGYGVCQHANRPCDWL